MSQIMGGTILELSGIWYILSVLCYASEFWVLEWVVFLRIRLRSIEVLSSDNFFTWKELEKACKMRDTLTGQSGTWLGGRSSFSVMLLFQAAPPPVDVSLQVPAEARVWLNCRHALHLHLSSS
jgi:hypothetical protein